MAAVICSVRMSNDSCGRLVTRQANDEMSVCHMHLPDARKDTKIFSDEIEVICARALEKEKSTIDFTGFHFPLGFNFPFPDVGTATRTFQRRAVFEGATFHGVADFDCTYFLE